ncbi:MAG: PqqD family protein [Anaerolineae bacterium]|nr:PqqD family protein [Anaerolineae bacterium]
MATLPIANPELVFRTDGEEGLLFDPETGQIIYLNETAAFIYGLLDGKHSREQIIGLLMQKYDILDREAAQGDLDTMLQNMREANLIGETA